MNYEDVQKFSNAAMAKAKLVESNIVKYFLRAMMAGFFISVAMIFSNVVITAFKATDPAMGKFLGSFVFAIAVLLIVFIGSELFTGNNLVMAMGAYDKKVTWGQACKVWLTSYVGNFVGCLIFSLIFVLAGASGTAEHFASIIDGKLNIPPVEMLFRAILCNFFVCLAVACGIKMNSESGKFAMICMCIAGFVVSGFEHCIANMSIFTVCVCLVPGVSISKILFSMVVVTLGNMIGGAVLLALPLRKMSADQ